MTQQQVAQKPLWHKNRGAQTTPINRSALEGGGGAGVWCVCVCVGEVGGIIVWMQQKLKQTIHTDGRVFFILKLL